MNNLPYNSNNNNINISNYINNNAPNHNNNTIQKKILETKSQYRNIKLIKVLEMKRILRKAIIKFLLKIVMIT